MNQEVDSCRHKHYLIISIANCYFFQNTFFTSIKQEASSSKGSHLRAVSDEVPFAETQVTQVVCRRASNRRQLLVQAEVRKLLGQFRDKGHVMEGRHLRTKRMSFFGGKTVPSHPSFLSDTSHEGRHMICLVRSSMPGG